MAYRLAMCCRCLQIKEHNRYGNKDACQLQYHELSQASLTSLVNWQAIALLAATPAVCVQVFQ